MGKWRVSSFIDDWTHSYGVYDSFTEAKDAGVNEYKRALAGEHSKLLAEWDGSLPPRLYVGKQVDFMPRVDPCRAINDVYAQAEIELGDDVPYDFLAGVSPNQVARLGTALDHAFSEWMRAENLGTDIYSMKSIQEINPSLYIKN